MKWHIVDATSEDAMTVSVCVALVKQEKERLSPRRSVI